MMVISRYLPKIGNEELFNLMVMVAIKAKSYENIMDFHEVTDCFY